MNDAEMHLTALRNSMQSENSTNLQTEMKLEHSSSNDQLSENQSRGVDLDKDVITLLTSLFQGLISENMIKEIVSALYSHNDNNDNESKYERAFELIHSMCVSDSPSVPSLTTECSEDNTMNPSEHSLEINAFEHSNASFDDIVAASYSYLYDDVSSLDVLPTDGYKALEEGEWYPVSDEVAHETEFLQQQCKQEVRNILNREYATYSVKVSNILIENALEKYQYDVDSATAYILQNIEDRATGRNAFIKTNNRMQSHNNSTRVNTKYQGTYSTSTSSYASIVKSTNKSSWLVDTECTTIGGDSNMITYSKSSSTSYVSDREYDVLLEDAIHASLASDESVTSLTTSTKADEKYWYDQIQFEYVGMRQCYLVAIHSRATNHVQIAQSRRNNMIYAVGMHSMHCLLNHNPSVFKVGVDKSGTLLFKGFCSTFNSLSKDSKPNRADSRTLLHTIDMHGITVRPAVQFVKSLCKYYKYAITSTPSSRSYCHQHKVTLIVGRGSHSVGGVQKLKPAIVLLLQQLKIPFSSTESELSFVLNDN